MCQGQPGTGLWPEQQMQTQTQLHCNCCINEGNKVLQATNLNTPEVKCLKYLYGGNG